MKIRLELFGASRDFSEKDHLEFKVQDKASIEDLRNEIIKYLDKNFKGNENFVEVVKLLPSQAPILLAVDSIMPLERFSLTFNKAVSHSLLT